MKRIQLISILLLAVLLVNFSLAANATSNVTASQTRTVNPSNPISIFMQHEVSSTTFQYIGAPTQLSYQNLIIYLLFILVAYVIIVDILSGVNLFKQKWITSAISLIVILLGVYSGTMYKTLTSITQIGFGGIFAAAITQYVVLGLIAAYLIIRTFIKITKRMDRTNKEKIEERAEKIKTLRKIQDIEAMGAGMK